MSEVDQPDLPALLARNAELEKDRQLFARVLGIARIGMWELDLVERRAEWSPETRRILGVPPDAPPTPETVMSVAHPDDKHLIGDALESVMAGSRRYDITYRVRWPDGSLRTIHSRGEVSTDASGRPVRIMGIVQDITEQEQMRTHLLQAQKLETVGRLAAGLAHDLNNMLTVIRGACDFLSESEGATSQPDIDTIIDATERAAALTRGLLAFSRQQMLRPTMTDVNQTLAGLQNMFKRLLGETISLSIDQGDGLGAVMVDSQQLVQVLVNLAMNARDAMPLGGTLRIRTSMASLPAGVQTNGPGDAPHVLIAIQDTGHGMDQATLGRVFEPFFTTKGPQEGTGLGLSSAFGIIAQSGGHLRADSAPGRGSTFEVYLPVAQAAPAPGVAAPRGAHRHTGAGSVLLVEDDAPVRKVAVRTLRQAGFTVHEAGSPEEALALAADAHIDVLVTDVLMPRQSGRELADQLLTKFPSMQVLFMSGYVGDPRLKAQGPRPGDAFLAKPFTPAQLTAEVMALLGARASPGSPVGRSARG